MKKILGAKVLLLITLLVGFTGCEAEVFFEDELIGRTWVGDLGFSYEGYPVESGVLFSGSGFATDNQYYFPEDGGRFATSLPVRWYMTEYGALRLDYGNNFPLLEIRDVYISGYNLGGTLYVNDVYDGPIVLRMQ